MNTEGKFYGGLSCHLPQRGELSSWRMMAVVASWPKRTAVFVLAPACLVHTEGACLRCGPFNSLSRSARTVITIAKHTLKYQLSGWSTTETTKLDNLMGERQTNQKARKRPSDELHYLQNTLQPGSTQKVIYKCSVAPEKGGAGIARD